MKRWIIFILFCTAYVLVVFGIAFFPGCVEARNNSPKQSQKNTTKQEAGRDAKSTVIQYISNGPGIWTIMLCQIPASMVGYWAGKGGWNGTRTVAQRVKWRRMARGLSSARDQHIHSGKGCRWKDPADL